MESKGYALQLVYLIYHLEYFIGSVALRIKLTMAIFCIRRTETSRTKLLQHPSRGSQILFDDTPVDDADPGGFRNPYQQAQLSF